MHCSECEAAVSEEAGRCPNCGGLIKLESVEGSNGMVPASDVAKDSPSGKILRAALALAVALVSFFLVAPVLSDPQFHAETIEVLDEKKANVVALAAASAGASVAIELLPLPGDAGNSIAVELASLSSDFAIIVAAILLEKYLLTVLALVSFRVLVPLACALYAMGLWRRFSVNFNAIALKTVALAATLMLVIPLSVQVSQIIDETFETSVLVAEASDATEPEVEGDIGLIDRLSDKAGDLSEWATTKLENLMEAFAIMVITSCVIPILIVFLALWIVNLILNVSVQAPMAALRGRAWRAPVQAKRESVLKAVGKRR